MISALLLFSIGYVAGQTCQQAGSMCYRVTTQPTGLVGGSCCDSCLPYVPGGGTTWDGTTDWYCMYGSNGGAEGATCSAFTGSCASGLTCYNGVCTSSSSITTGSSASTTASSSDSTSASSSDSTSASSSDSTTASSSDSTTASSSDSTTASTAAASTTEACTAMGGDICGDTTYGISKTCCSPYSCVSVSSRTSTCQGSSLAAGEACYSGGAELGTCATGLMCLDGVCKEDDASCAEPVFPQGYCHSAELNRDVATCCSGSYCMKPSDNADSFCMSFSIAEGLPCGVTQAEEYRGFCASPLNCINGVCSSDATTTTTTTTTTTVTTTTGPTTTAAPCLNTGEQCWGGPGTGDPVNCCGGTCPIGPAPTFVSTC